MAKKKNSSSADSIGTGLGILLLIGLAKIGIDTISKGIKSVFTNSYVLLALMVITPSLIIIIIILCIRRSDLAIKNVKSYTPRQYNIYSIDAMSGIEFEKFVAQQLYRGGFINVEMTKASGDFGADLIAVDRDGDRWAIQCKRYNKPLGLKPIQEVVSSRNHYNATQTAVITNSTFTKNAILLASQNYVALVDRLHVCDYEGISLESLLYGGIAGK